MSAALKIIKPRSINKTELEADELIWKEQLYWYFCESSL